MAYTFLRWLRTGLAAALGTQPQAAGAAQRAKLTLGVTVSGTALTSQSASIALDVLGPGDVTGLDPRQVIRTFPVAGTLDFEPAYHAHVELDRPDLPWLFTPFGPTTDGVLRPWIALVVVERGDDVALTPAVPLPRLTVSGAEVAELPDLDEAHAWAHVQVAGDTSQGIEHVVDTAPDRILSRLVCPRVLDPDRAYLACIVPTFAIGALAGLGAEVPATVPLDAWSATDVSVVLPVFHSWEFSTTDAADFRSLVLRLRAEDHLEGVGTRPLDVRRPGFGVADRPAAAPVALGGALRVDEPVAAPADPGLAAELEPLLGATDAVGPPIHGRWHAAVTGVSLPASGWPETLNLDVRHRVAAGLGAQVVQDRQEDLMAAVWEQLGEVLRANQLLRQAQLAVAASERIVERHLAPLSGPELLAVAGPALTRIRIGPQLTVRGAASASCLPVLALSGAFRRVTRTRGPIVRRLGLPQRTGRASFPDVAPAPAADPVELLRALASGALAAPAPKLPDGAVALPSSPAPKWRGGRPPSRAPRGGDGPLEELGPAFAELARRAGGPACSPLDLDAAGGVVRDALRPRIAVAGRARDRVKLPAGSRVLLTRRLDPIMAAPEIPTPMIRPLSELGTEWLLPGLGDVPHDTITIVEPDRAFIEAYLVGLNHEMGRELLWRGFPTDQRGTVFSRFWDRQGAVGTPTAPVPDRDVPDLHTWDPASALGAHLAGGTSGLVVLLVRGALLERYPHATIFAQRARWERDSRGRILFDGSVARREPVPLPDDAAWEANVRFASFTTRTGADTAFLGFPLTAGSIRGTARHRATQRSRDNRAGWYLVFQEQPTEPRFGPVATPLPTSADRRSDALAAALLRPAFRLFVHGSDLVTG